MMKNFIATVAAVLMVLAHAPAFSANDVSTAEFIRLFKEQKNSCPKRELGQITKVELLDGKGVAKLSKGQMPTVPGKKYAAIHHKAGAKTGWSIDSSPLNPTVNSEDINKALVGQLICVLSEDEF